MGGAVFDGLVDAKNTTCQVAPACRSPGEGVRARAAVFPVHANENAVRDTTNSCCFAWYEAVVVVLQSAFGGFAVEPRTFPNVPVTRHAWRLAVSGATDPSAGSWSTGRTRVPPVISAPAGIWASENPR